MARIGHADRLSSGLPSGALRYFDDDVVDYRPDIGSARFLGEFFFFRGKTAQVFRFRDSDNSENSVETRTRV